MSSRPINGAGRREAGGAGAGLTCSPGREPAAPGSLPPRARAQPWGGKAPRRRGDGRSVDPEPASALAGFRSGPEDVVLEGRLGR